jgi:ElaB/YqjD/DUF883 family membrane-anchored ribosome-binding protein
MARPEELPEGTDHIINGAMATDDAEGGGGGGGFVASGGGDDDTGGTSRGSTQSGGERAMATTNSGGDGGGNEAGGVREQLTSQVQALRGQAGDRVREFADGGKTRASDALEELSRIVADTADSIDERLGGQYGEYARKASDAVSGFADTLRRTDVDELYDNVRETVRKSPGIAIGVAAVVGFTLARLAKSGLEAERARDGGGASGGSAAKAGGKSGAGKSAGGKAGGSRKSGKAEA